MDDYQMCTGYQIYSDFTNSHCIGRVITRCVQALSDPRGFDQQQLYNVGDYHVWSGYQIYSDVINSLCIGWVSTRCIQATRSTVMSSTATVQDGRLPGMYLIYIDTIDNVYDNV